MNHAPAHEFPLTPPSICGLAEVDLAHEQMRRHRECRIDECAWKRTAYHTLVHFGRLAPQRLSPRERAHGRGIEFGTIEPRATESNCAETTSTESSREYSRWSETTTAGTDHARLFDAPLEPHTFHQILDGLNRLADDLRHGPTDRRTGPTDHRAG